jgi:hypothetical protein
MLELLVMLRTTRGGFLAILRLARVFGLDDAQTERLLAEYGY